MTKRELDEKKHYVKKSYVDAKNIVIRGNMFMLAIGLLLGASFGAVISSLATDVIMSAITRAIDVSVQDWILWQKVVDGKIVGGIYIGKFLAALLQFIIVSIFIFFGLLTVFLIRNRMAYAKAKKMPIEEEQPAPISHQEMMLDELRKLNENLMLLKDAPKTSPKN
ncbi:MscL family protein [Mycoplasma phocoeninasale]|uniref:MscL family protein n=1 Tax=Mycoplasma phocoeninasale TaxID=2726117 RepID=A0A858U4D5_9MOLU|nr:MscL family protein [Mycoplasma phocoeninasale]MBN0970617.1 MscL family protein [Mycoplasma phocoeninasale]QJG66267.1 MscL family protein [Mycoplasma phocoeninasale]